MTACGKVGKSAFFVDGRRERGRASGEGSTEPETKRDSRSSLTPPRVELIPILDSTAVRYAEIPTYLRGAGNPIPTNAVWIAASAMEHGLRVITTNKHFQEVPQILVDCWEPWS